MIRSLIIGNNDDVVRYENFISESNFYGHPSTIVFDNAVNNGGDDEEKNSYDALFVVSSLEHCSLYIEEAIKHRIPVYICSQLLCNAEKINHLSNLQREAASLIYISIPETTHPLLKLLPTLESYQIDVFCTLSYKSNEVEQTVIAALSVIHVLSRKAIKTVDVLIINNERHSKNNSITIQLKLYGGSLCTIHLIQKPASVQKLEIASPIGNFNLDFSKNTLITNSSSKSVSRKNHQRKFKSELNSINEFALCMIMDAQPEFTVDDLNTLSKPLSKILNSLHSNM